MVFVRKKSIRCPHAATYRRPCRKIAAVCNRKQAKKILVQPWSRVRGRARATKSTFLMGFNGFYVKVKVPANDIRTRWPTSIANIKSPRVVVGQGKEAKQYKYGFGSTSMSRSRRSIILCVMAAFKGELSRFRNHISMVTINGECVMFVSCGRCGLCRSCLRPWRHRTYLRRPRACRS